MDSLARHSPREYGTGAETTAGDYLAARKETLGYEVSFRGFDFVENETGSLVVNGEMLKTNLMRNTAVGSHSRPLAYFGLLREQDMPDEGLEGRIALIKRGEILFQEKGANVAAAGAVAAVVFNHEPDLFGGFVQGLDSPVLSLSGEDGETLLARLKSGEKLEADLAAAIEVRQSRNIVAYKAGTGDIDETPILGAHYDTLPDVVVPNDNAAGVSVLRMVPEHMGGMELPFWSNHTEFREVGLPVLAFSTDNSRTTALFDNNPPEVSIAAVSDKVTEGTDARYRVTRAGRTSETLRVGLYVTGLPKIMADETEAIVLTSESDDPMTRLDLYGAAVDYILEFAAGEAEKELSLTTEADNVNEGDGWLAVSILRGTSVPYTIENGRAQVHVVDDDLPTVSLTRPVGPTGLTLSGDGTTWEGEIMEGTEFTYGVSCTATPQFPASPGPSMNPLVESVFYANHPALYSEASQAILGYNVSNLLPVGRNCSSAMRSNTTDRFFVGPENGVMEIVLVSPGDLIPIPGSSQYYQTALLAEHRRQSAEAAAEAEAAGTLITRKNIFAIQNIGRIWHSLLCNESSYQYCPQYQVGTVKKIRLAVINRDPTILIRAETDSVSEGQPARFLLERQWASDLLELSVPLSETVVYLRASQNGQYISGDLPTTVTFGRNETHKVIALDTVDDDAIGPDGSVTIELLPDTSGSSVNIQGKYTTWRSWAGHTPAGKRSDKATVSITDDDTKGIVIVPASLTVTEGDTTGTSYTVKLAIKPTGDVRVSITGHYCTSLTLSGNTLRGGRLTFTPDDWDRPQTVTVKAAYDHNAVDDEETLTHTASGGGYSDVSEDLPVSVTDDAAHPLSVQGVVPAPTRVELPDQDFPFTDDTWGFVDTSATSSGTMEKTGNDGVCSGDRWRLRTIGGRHYRVQVKFGNTDPDHAIGGGLDIYEGAGRQRGDLWDHMSDDGRAFIEFYANPNPHQAPYYLRVRARSFGEGTTRKYFGPYTIALTDISHINRMASNRASIKFTENADGTFTHSLSSIGGDNSNDNFWRATSFTTGPLSGGYKLEYVGTDLLPRVGKSAPKAALYTDSSSAPGTKIFDFDRIDRISDAYMSRQNHRFWVPSTAADLTASTTYWVVFKNQAVGTTFQLPTAKDGADKGASGWSVGDKNAHYNVPADTPTWVVPTSTKPLVIEVYASAVATDEALEAVEQVVADRTAPEFQSAFVYFATMSLTFDEALDASSTPPASAFSVHVNGSPLEATTVSVNGDTVDLSLAWWVEAGDTVTVSYTIPTATSEGKVQDPAGNPAATFSGQEATNYTEPIGGSGGSSNDGRSAEGNSPGVPTNLEVALHRSGALRATWQAPDSGPTPDGYTAQWKRAADDWQDPKEVSEKDVAKTSYVINGLDDGVEYAVRVLATVNNGDGEPSGEVTAMPQETTPPSVSSATVDGAELTFTFDEPLDETALPSTYAFAVAAAGNSRAVKTVAQTDSSVTLTLATAVVAGDVVTVDYTAPANEQSARLRDLAGNEAASFIGQVVTNGTQATDPLIARVSELPVSHDGHFTFELRFSEEPRDGFSYRTMRDHAFTVTGGVVAKARRLAPPSNIGWEVHITPDGNDPVTIALPVTTDCTLQGAICTGDRRPLSERVEITVQGASE